MHSITCTLISELHIIITIIYMYIGQYEELKKAKNDLEEDVIRERTAHKSYKKDCAALKAEYNNIKLRVSIVISV